MIKVWVKRPFEIGRVEYVKGDLDSLQALVDGPIEVVPFESTKEYCILVNEEGLLRGDMRLNIIIGHYFLFGPVVIIGVKETDDGDEFCSCDLTASQVRRLIAKEAI